MIRTPANRGYPAENRAPGPTIGTTGFLGQVLLGSVLLWLAFPPVGWSPLVWVAPVCWLRAVTLATLPGKRPYRTLWGAGFLFWLLAVHWIRLPHPLNYLGWIVLSAYLGCYLPLFVALARTGVQRGWPLWIVAPSVWTGLDWLRSHLLSGFLMGSLAHTQVAHPAILQLAACCGEYGVTFVIVLVAACMTQTWNDLHLPSTASSSPPRPAWTNLIPGGIALIFVLSIGHANNLQQSDRADTGPRLALIQGNTLADWKNDLDKQRAIMAEYFQLSMQALGQAAGDEQPIDLVIWPETAFRQSLVTVAPNYEVPPTIHPSYLTAGKNELADLVRQLDTAVLVGIDHVRLSPGPQGPRIDYYNAAVMLDRHATRQGLYHKMHRVVFGEYVPFADWFPALNRVTPITGAIQAGHAPVGMQLNGVHYAVSICYETVVPHLIRQHVVMLAHQGQAPHVLVNLTNDAWFWGSSELDMHLACGVLRAIEMRTPLVIAANGGLSAAIDADGSVLCRSPRMQTATLLVDLKISPRTEPYPSFYAAHGDWFALLCVVYCAILAILSWGPLHARRSATPKCP